jgi:hypothetical protein
MNLIHSNPLHRTDQLDGTFFRIAALNNQVIMAVPFKAPYRQPAAKFPSTKVALKAAPEKTRVMSRIFATRVSFGAYIPAGRFPFPYFALKPLLRN